MSAHSTSKSAYPSTFALLGLALAFPVALMIFNPTLMFERGWEQYVGTALYTYAVIALAAELLRLRKEEAGFAAAPALLADPGGIAEGESRLLPARIKQLMATKASPSQLMELNREASGLDQEQAAGRFTITKYVLYLLPTIGFIGTVEGISKALMNISRVLPMVKNLDDFMANLTSVTSALQIAFDSTLLALFLSAALMLVQTLVYRRSEDLLARVDRWVVDRVVAVTREEAPQNALSGLVLQFEAIQKELAALGQRSGRRIGDERRSVLESHRPPAAGDGGLEPRHRGNWPSGRRPSDHQRDRRRPPQRCGHSGPNRNGFELRFRHRRPA